MTVPKSHGPGFLKQGLADWVKNLIEKKRPGLSESEMVTGGLNRNL